MPRSLSGSALVVLTIYAVRAPALHLNYSLQDMLRDRAGGVECGELVTREKSAGRLLSNGVFAARWSRKAEMREEISALFLAFAVYFAGYYGYITHRWNYRVYTFGFAPVAGLLLGFAVMKMVFPELSLLRQLAGGAAVIGTCCCSWPWFGWCSAQNEVGRWMCPAEGVGGGHSRR